MFVKGKSGNPSGRPGGAKSFAKYIRDNTRDLQEFADVCLDIMRNKSKTESTRDRLNALTILLNRALGRAEQVISLDTNDGSQARVSVDKLDAVQLAELEALLERAAVRH